MYNETTKKKKKSVYKVQQVKLLLNARRIASSLECIYIYNRCIRVVLTVYRWGTFLFNY